MIELHRLQNSSSMADKAIIYEDKKMEMMQEKDESQSKREPLRPMNEP